MNEDTVWQLTQDGASFIGILLTFAALFLGYFDWRLNQRPPSWWQGEFENFRSVAREDIADLWGRLHRGPIDDIPYFDTMTPDEITRIRSFFPKSNDAETDHINTAQLASKELSIEASFDQLKVVGEMLDRLSLANSNWERFRDEMKERSFFRPMIVLVAALLFQLYGAYPESFWEISAKNTSREVAESNR